MMDAQAFDEAHNMNTVRRWFVPVTLVVLTMGITMAAIVLAYVRRQDQALQYTLICETPWIANPIQGMVVRFQGTVPVAGAEVTIENTSPELARCSEFSYISTLHVTTDADGVFSYTSGDVAHPDQTFSITITAEGCDDYHADGVVFASLTVKNTPFVLNCESGDSGQ